MPMLLLLPMAMEIATARRGPNAKSDKEEAGRCPGGIQFKIA